LCCPHYCLLTFVKARCFVLPGVAKGKKNQQENRRTSSTSFLLGFCFSFQNGFVYKKKQFVCWKFCFLVNEKYKEKKSFSFVHKTTFWLLVRKNKSKCWTSVVPRLVLKERQRQTKQFFFVFAGIALLSKQEKRSFFWSCFLFCLKLFLRAKPLKAKHVKKKPFFHAFIQIGAQNIHIFITFPFVFKFYLTAFKKKNLFVVFCHAQ